jgi:hypothetical protein
MDVLFIEDMAYCISVSTPPGMTMITKLPAGRHETVMLGALKDHVASYTSKGYKIGHLWSDNEYGIKSSR